MMAKYDINEEKFQEILHDAEVNFENQRYADAANTFEFLSNWCLEHNRPEDMLYFQYRAILAFKIIRKTEALVNKYQKLAINALKASTVYAMNEVNSPHVENKIALLWYVQQNLKMLDDENNRKSILMRLHNIFQQILDDEDLDDHRKIKYLDQSIQLSNDLGMTDQLIKDSKLKSQLIIQEGESILSSNGIDVEIIAAHKFLEAAQILNGISEMDETRELINKAKELYPDINLKKFNLDQFSVSFKRSN